MYILVKHFKIIVKINTHVIFVNIDLLNKINPNIMIIS